MNIRSPFAADVKDIEESKKQKFTTRLKLWNKEMTGSLNEMRNIEA